MEPSLLTPGSGKSGVPLPELPAPPSVGTAAKARPSAFSRRSSVARIEGDATLDWQFTRTHLANERTFLAWIRTSLSLFTIGFAVLKIESLSGGSSKLPWYDAILGFLFFASAVVAFAIGAQRYYRVLGGLTGFSLSSNVSFQRIGIRHMVLTLSVVFVAAIVRVVVTASISGFEAD